MLSRLEAYVQAQVGRLLGRRFAGSREYWEKRYAVGGTSGTGSYGRLAQFKATFLNRFIVDHEVSSVIEFGCGDGNQLQYCNYAQYFGVDVSDTALSSCMRLYANDRSKRFGSSAPSDEFFDLSLSLDVIYHLVEHGVYEEYMRQLFAASRRFVIIYSSNLPHAEFERRHQRRVSPHVFHRRFSDWIDEYEPAWRLMNHTPNAFPYDVHVPETSFADFYVYSRGE